MHPRIVGRPTHAFTLIELLVVIAIIAILIGLLFPSLFGMYERAKKVQAKNDLNQIVNAVNAFYTEYGRYPLPGAPTTPPLPNSYTYGPGGEQITNVALFTELRACTAIAGSCPAIATLNTRQIVFISPPDAKNAASPRLGIGTAAGNIGQYFDPWGNQLHSSHRCRL